MRGRISSTNGLTFSRGAGVAACNATAIDEIAYQRVELPAGTLGYIYLPALVTIVAASVLTAPLGVKAAHALSITRLRQVFAMLLYGLAAYMLWKGIAG